MSKANNLIWLDLEMTGLDTESDTILEIATIVTDRQLNIVAQGPSLVIHQSDEVLAAMGPWCQNQHKSTGLIDRVRASKISLKDAEVETLLFLKEHVSINTAPMCGNSICMDRRFLARYMPELEAFFHYRMIDVSTIKELAKTWAPSCSKTIEKQNKHLALDDIIDSINELKHYKEHFFKIESPPLS